ncbi:MAG: aminotransferase class V-fold PLP-dependent enzyme [Clostridiales bacterium]|nr:aminotransferase class V-fold PLP-dependent enzyme [Clostridiales bacterium]
MITLKERLESINTYPFHMPGHKRNTKFFKNDIFKYDFTEIEGIDDLHHPTEILKQRMDYASEVYGTKKTYFLINGSTCGLLAAISAHTNIGDNILVARNCHKSVYNALFLRNLKPVYVSPPITGEGISGGIAPKEVEEILKTTGAKVFVMVSPTYEGIVSDIKAISEVCHKYGCVLIVDEAHGAHFGFCGKFPKSAVSLGADIVIQSLHKTLPSLTQTALLHICSKRADICETERHLSIYQSSSPSYILLSSADSCIKYMSGKEGKSAAEVYFRRLSDFREENKGRIMGDEIKKGGNVFDTDPSKIIIWGGKKTSTALRMAGLEPEMENLFYTLAITSIGDTEEGFKKLGAAISALKPTNIKPEFEKAPPPKIKMTPYETGTAAGEQIPLNISAGRISKTAVYIYPPGISIINEGEEITPQIIDLITQYNEKGFAVRGITDKINCVK